MLMTEIIERKKLGFELTKQELEFVARSAADGSVPDYQLSAWLMAVWFNKMTEREATDFTLAMAASGGVTAPEGIKGPVADKHSTGGVGDKTTLVVAPIVACCGVKVAKMSGRGLGFSGGTIDKLEAIRGLSTSFTPERFVEIVNSNGLCISSQTKGLAPADKKLYALRDVTCTVDCLPLIASSVMSKKLAGGADIIVLDVKCGSGSFMKTRGDAEQLARLMVGIGKSAGKNTVALVTDMNAPLGHNIGNLMEVSEAVELLMGHGDPDLCEICFALANQILVCAGFDTDAAQRAVQNAVTSGAALRKLAATVALQGGDSSWITEPALIPVAPFVQDVTAAESGYITALDTKLIGESAKLLGAGREVMEDLIEPTAGITVLAKPGDYVRYGQPIARLYAAQESRFDSASKSYCASVLYSDDPPERRPLIYSTIC